VEMAWIFLHWNLIYFVVFPQYALVQGAFSYLVADMYSSYRNGTLKRGKYRFYVLTMIVILLVVIISGRWAGPLV